jgi:uncharacterized membrane protein HdeD (DUF308 family)
MTNIEVSGLVGGLLSIFAGIAVIVWPRIIAYVIGVYLIVIGIIAVLAAVTSR